MWVVYLGGTEIQVGNFNMEDAESTGRPRTEEKIIDVRKKLLEDR